MPDLAVFQPRPGLGDLIWHLPLIRALAQDGPITLITKPSTQADALLAGDTAIGRIVWFDHNPRQGIGRHDGPLGFPRLVATLRATGAQRCVLLHHSASLAAAMRLAGIERRQGYGYARAQRVWLNEGPFLGPEVRFAEAFDQARAYAAACGFAGLPEPSVAVDGAARACVVGLLAGLPRPVLALGIGSHGASRQWGAARFTELAQLWLRRAPGSVVLLAGPQEAGMAQQVMQASPTRMLAAVAWDLAEVVAVLEQADVFVGNDSGLMNLRAAVGRPAIGLFGASGPLRHSRLIHAVVPAAGPRAGMEAIGVGAVLAMMEGRMPEQGNGR